MIATDKTETPLALPPSRSSKLSNGMEVVVAERRGLPLVTARLELLGGSATDSISKAGLAEFASQLLRRGTKNRSADEIDEEVERVGGSLGIDVDVDSIAISVSLPSEHLGAALDVLADLAMNPRFPPSEVAAAKSRTLAALANDLDDPSTIADKAATFYALAGHPYANPTGGWTRSVKTFSRADALAFHARAFGPDRAAIYVVGDTGGADVEALVKKRFGKWARAEAPFGELPAVPEPGDAQVILVDKDDATQTQIRIISAGIARNDPSYFACAVAAGILGGGFTSRLMEEIRVNRGLSYGVSSRFHSFRRGGEFSIATFTKTETTAEAIQVTLDVTRKLAEQGPSGEELLRTKTYINGLFPLQLETNEQLARMLADLRLYGIGNDYVSRFRERISNVAVDEVKQAARAHFPIDRYTLVCVGKAKAIKKALAPFGPKVIVKKLAELE